MYYKWQWELICLVTPASLSHLPRDKCKTFIDTHCACVTGAEQDLYYSTYWRTFLSDVRLRQSECWAGAYWRHSRDVAWDVALLVGMCDPQIWHPQLRRFGTTCCLHPSSFTSLWLFKCNWTITTILRYSVTATGLYQVYTFPKYSPLRPDNIVDII